MNDTSSPLSDPRAKRWGTFVKYAGLLLLGFIVAPYVFTAIAGLIGLAVAGALIGGYWIAMPKVETWAANMRLKLVKAEAAKNPIETLENDFHERTQKLNDNKNRLAMLIAKTEGFGSQLEQFKKLAPSRAAKFEEVYAKMHQLCNLTGSELKKAKDALKDREGQIEIAKAEWGMALSAKDLTKDAGQIEQDFLAKLKTDTAFCAVTDGMNNAFAQVDILLLEGESTTINVTPAQPMLAAASAANVRLVLLIALALAGCSKSPQVVYRIPPDKQEAAAKMTVQLTDSMSHGLLSINTPSNIADSVRAQVLAVYGEPVPQPSHP